MSKYSKIHLCKLVLILCLTFCPCYQAWLKEGERCYVNDQSGICTAVDKCRSNIPKGNVDDSPICSIANNTRIICCLKEDDKEPVRDPLSHELVPKNGQKAWDKCLDYLRDADYSCKPKSRPNRPSTELTSTLKNNLFRKQKMVPKIAGGEDVKKTQFSHMALLGFGNESRSISWMCGGSLISDKFVLTAAHCTQMEGQKVTHIALGILKRSDVQRSQRHLVQRIIPHPEYQSSTIYNDIALLETTWRVVFTHDVVPACLAISDPPYTYSSLRNKDACATGWGFLGRKKILANDLQVVYLKEYDYLTCKKIYPIHRNLPEGINETTQFCFGDDQRSKDTCPGDSGGPLQIPGQASDCQYSIIGVTSHGNTCPSQAGLYTRVQPYISWIESVVWP